MWAGDPGLARASHIRDPRDSDSILWLPLVQLMELQRPSLVHMSHAGPWNPPTWGHGFETSGQALALGTWGCCGWVQSTQGAQHRARVPPSEFSVVLAHSEGSAA